MKITLTDDNGNLHSFIELVQEVPMIDEQVAANSDTISPDETSVTDAPVV